MGNLFAKKRFTTPLSDEHKIPLNEVLKRYQSDATNGLSEDEAKKVLARDGPNRIDVRKYWQKSVKDIDKLEANIQSVLPGDVEVIRDGVAKTISYQQLVVGDIVNLKEGDRVPADIRVIAVDSCKLDTKFLTCAEDPRIVTLESSDDNTILTTNLAHMSDLITEGSLKGIVLRVGEHTNLAVVYPACFMTLEEDNPNVRVEVTCTGPPEPSLEKMYD